MAFAYMLNALLRELYLTVEVRARQLQGISPCDGEQYTPEMRLLGNATGTGFQFGFRVPGEAPRIAFHPLVLVGDVSHCASQTRTLDLNKRERESRGRRLPLQAGCGRAQPNAAFRWITRITWPGELPSGVPGSFWTP
jgi:hypothetical protein